MTEEKDLSRLRIDRGSPGVQPARRRSKRAIVAVLLAATLSALAGGYLLSNRVQEVEVATVTTAFPSQAYSLLNATGYVVAQRKAAVASKAAGRVEWLGVVEGSRVREGDVVARLENRDVTAAMEQAAASVKVAQANLLQGQAEMTDADSAYRRARELQGKGFISEASVDAAAARYNKAKAGITGFEAAVAVARANLRAAQVAVDQTVIRAPFDGVVLTKSANVGDVVTPFSSALDTKGAVVTMADMSTLEVEADVSESNLAKVKVGQPCEVQLDALPGMRFRGAVSRMVPTVDRSKATVLVKVQFVDKDPRVLPDMTAKVSFLEKEVSQDQRTAVTAVQPAAIVERGGRKVAFLVANGQALETPVETGGKLGDLVQVAQGLVPGQKVVLSPRENLRDGARVKPVQK
ncbi:MAG TPA: efflux RND transporter periplasmic adaptor subunit [Burkholderiales bacterium]|nr:efflux RND transporter periplasmic adaptor subunit [Burkholderiales bacterium]